MNLVKLVIAGGVVIGKVSRCGVLVAWFIGSTVAEVIEQMKGGRP